MKGSKPRVLVTRSIFEEALESLRKETELKVWEEDRPIPREVLLREVREVEGLLSMLTDRIDATVLDQAPRLKVISNMAAGCDNIDLEEASRRGIPVGHTPGVLAKTCADFTLALLLAAARKVAQGDRFVREGRWQSPWKPEFFLGVDIHQRTLGIIGMGAIGLEVAKRALGFDMDILYYSRTQRWYEEERYKMDYVDLPTLLRNADFVTLHVPLTPETHHLIGEKELALMKPTAILINTSRGPVVDSMALYRALKEHRIAAAALDVFEEEPIPPDHPLLSLDNVVFTPHIASATQATRRKMALMAAENLLAGLRGEEIPHCINRRQVGNPPWRRAT